MDKIVLDKDEVVLLEEGYTWYSGSLERVDSVDRLVLTNKRILATWRKRKESGILEIPASEIKKYKDSLCVDDFEYEHRGEWLRVQTMNGIELFRVAKAEDTSIREDLRDAFGFGKKDKQKDKNTVAWVEKIKEAFGDPEAVEAPQKPKIVESAPVPIKENPASMEPAKKEEKIIVCSSCGKEYPAGSKFCPHCGAETAKPKVVEVEKTVEVAICRKCGVKMPIGTSFCPSCGAPVIEEEKKPAPEPKRESKIEKCPVCGEILPSDAVVCPSCGHEIRGREATISIAQFSKLISSISDEDTKIEAIKNYVIPNSKEDIMEFMLFATSNFDEKLYLSNVNGDNIACAWHTKIEQCYKKAMLMFTDQNDIRKIEGLYNECVSKTVTTKKRKIVMTIFGIIMMTIGTVLMFVPVGVTNEEGKYPLSWLMYIGMGIVGIGVLSFVSGIKKKKTNKQLREEKAAKANRRKRR